MDLNHAKRIAVLTALTMIPVAALAAAAVSPESSGELLNSFMNLILCSKGCPNG